MERKPRICIVAHNAYGALVNDASKHIGGVEIQTKLMSSWLIESGYEVDVITWDEGPVNEAALGGINNLKLCRKESGLPLLKFIHPRWTSLISALRLSNSDIYYHNCGEYVTGQIALWCKSNRKVFVYSVASDPECDPDLPEMKTKREKILFKLGLKYADRIITQTIKQQESLKKGFGLDSITLPMPAMTQANQFDDLLDKSSRKVIWVGRFSKVKNIELLFSIAKELPEIVFDVVGGVDTDMEYANEIHNEALKYSNVHLHGKLPKDKLVDYYKSAKIMICTSLYEGFPNTFLEAWSYGLPIISTVDPDGLIMQKRLGAVYAGKDSGVHHVRDVMKNDSLWKSLSSNAKKYFFENHEISVAMKRFDELFRSIS